MIKVILYLVFYIVGVSVTIAQVKSEPVVLKDNAIELPGTLAYNQTNVPLIIWIYDSGNLDSDLQVKESDARDLHKANQNEEIKIIRKMNHVLKEVKSDLENQTSYLKPDFPLSSELIKTVVKFIKK